MQGSKTTAVMEQFNIRPHKRYGQNFLRDDNILRNIAEKSGITEKDTVLEIGPGLGSLTAALAERAGKVIAVEIDRELIPVLKETLRDHDNIEIINEDILKTDLNTILKDHKSVRVVANLPYYITTPVIMKLLEESRQGLISSITVMVQQEVAERMQAGSGGKEYGALSLAVSYRAAAGIIMRVPPECFVPRPKVDSAVIKLDIYPEEERPFKTDNEELLFSIIRAAFGQRRKTLCNSLSNASIPGVTKEKLTKVLESMGLSPAIRGEALDIGDFITLTDKILS